MHFVKEEPTKQLDPAVVFWRTTGNVFIFLQNYVAIGFARDNSLKGMDMSACYIPDANSTRIEAAHLYLVDKAMPPQPHQGVRQHGKLQCTAVV